MSKKSLSRYEKTWMMLLVLALVLLIVKSTMMDSIAPSTPEIERFRLETTNELERPPVKVVRLIKVEMVTSEGQPALKGIFRKYLFGIMPYGDYVAIKMQN